MTKTLVVGRRTLVAVVVAAVIVFSTGSNALAAQFAYEGFEYMAGSNLATSGAANAQWAGAWVDVATNGLFGVSTIESGSLTYTDTLGNVLTTTGNKVLVTGTNGTNSQQTRDMTTRRGADATSTWVSFLGLRIGEKSGTAGAGGTPTYERGANYALFDTGSDGTQAVEKLNVGESSGVANDVWMLRQSTLPSGTGVGQRDKLSTLPLDQTAFYVMRIDHHGAIDDQTMPGWDDVRFWINPALNGTPTDGSAAGTNLATDGTMTSMSFTRFRTFSGNLSGTQAFAQWYTDELRVGDTFADVAPFTPVVTSVAGDYNDNDVVDAADYAVWREAQSAGAMALPNRGTGILGAVGAADYDFWKSRFGATSGAGSGSGLGANVPEPATWIGCALACGGWWTIGSRRRAALGA